MKVLVQAILRNLNRSCVKSHASLTSKSLERFISSDHDDGSKMMKPVQPLEVQNKSGIDSNFKVKTCTSELIELRGEFEGGSRWTLRYDVRDVLKQLTQPLTDSELYKLVSSRKCILETRRPGNHNLYLFQYTGSYNFPSLVLNSYAPLPSFMKNIYDYLMSDKLQADDKKIEKEIQFVEKTFDIVSEEKGAAAMIIKWRKKSVEIMMDKGVDKATYQIMDCLRDLSKNVSS